MKSIVCLAAALLSVAVSCSKSSLVPVNLRVESMEEPNCIDVASPRLTWVDNPVSDKVCNESQSAYRIVVASSLKDLRSGKNLLWDTGKTDSPCALRINYGGEPLSSGQDCWWKVMVWDSKGKASAWSRPGHWTMGMMDPGQWKASWKRNWEASGSPDGPTRKADISFPSTPWMAARKKLS